MTAPRVAGRTQSPCPKANGRCGRRPHRDQDAPNRAIWLLPTPRTLRACLSEYSAFCTKCLVVALAGCSLSVTANVRTKGRRPLVLACDIVTKLSASHRGVRTSEGVDLWPLRAMSLAVEASAADVPDNRPLSGGFVGRSCSRKIERQLAHGWRERWLVDGDAGPGRSDDDVAVNGDASYRFGQTQRSARRAAAGLRGGGRQAFHARSCCSRSARSAAMARAVWLFTAPQLMPIAAATSASEKSA